LIVRAVTLPQTDGTDRLTVVSFRQFVDPDGRDPAIVRPSTAAARLLFGSV